MGLGLVCVDTTLEVVIGCVGLVCVLYYIGLGVRLG